VARFAANKSSSRVWCREAWEVLIKGEIFPRAIETKTDLKHATLIEDRIIGREEILEYGSCEDEDGRMCVGTCMIEGYSQSE
jgi:hypothetical protein